MIRVSSNEFRKRFKGRAFISMDDLRAYFEEKEPQLTNNVLYWHIDQLKRNQTLVSVRRGLYTLNKKPLFKPVINRKLQKLQKHIDKTFSPDVTCIIWSTEWLHQFMVQQPFHSITILEIEKEYLRTAFDSLRENQQNVFINPSKEVVHEYVLNYTDAIVIKPHISRSPTIQVKEKVVTASLEKILVDIFCDPELFVSYQGQELGNIFNNAWKHYSLNLSALTNYAKRRKRYEGLLDFFESVVSKEFYNLLKQ